MKKKKKKKIRVAAGGGSRSNNRQKKIRILDRTKGGRKTGSKNTKVKESKVKEPTVRKARKSGYHIMKVKPYRGDPIISKYRLGQLIEKAREDRATGASSGDYDKLIAEGTKLIKQANARIRAANKAGLGEYISVVAGVQTAVDGKAPTISTSTKDFEKLIENIKTARTVMNPSGGETATTVPALRLTQQMLHERVENLISDLTGKTVTVSDEQVKRFWKAINALKDVSDNVYYKEFLEEGIDTETDGLSFDDIIDLLEEEHDRIKGR